jgi:hypothetical protein
LVKARRSLHEIGEGGTKAKCMSKDQVNKSDTEHCGSEVKITEILGFPFVEKDKYLGNNNMNVRK